MFDDEVSETPAGHGHGTPRWHDKAKAMTPASFVGHVCELRTANSAPITGELVAIRPPWATLVQHSGRETVVRLDAITAIVRQGGPR